MTRVLHRTGVHDAAVDTDPHWRMHAVCRSIGDYLFFAAPGESSGVRARRERAAKQICTTCPVLMQCRAYAHANPEPYGVWGGMSEAERNATSSTPTITGS
ncbi:WhiB family transcriptional regulator [Rhodococcus ruber BKS 20-38]|uniref:Transcriptional regulator WhiB n=1 Tax=Rhodococcus ruber BKS 20-38 TaxID=1278076 RepID=M2ZHX2_9NOCA|nr:WhiB family transcriptional regulator [Rhodococcus ruber BKS 20-38]